MPFILTGLSRIIRHARFAKFSRRKKDAKPSFLSPFFLALDPTFSITQIKFRALRDGRNLIIALRTLIEAKHSSIVGCFSWSASGEFNATSGVMPSSVNNSVYFTHLCELYST